MPSMNDIRANFLQYFKSNDHVIVPSAPVVPQNDPTLLFTNAGMVQFKNVFTGVETLDYVRAVSSQKCIRAGGKHNDLDNVGYTARHHTFFEMLGNFSFGDYFKEKAIFYAWDFLTRELGINPERLLVTVYAEDEVAAALWKKISGLSDDRIIRISTSDNFWSMGDTGPCGPCSEIFYDHGSDIFGGPPGSADEDGDRFVEIWNLVFMQFDQPGDGSRIDLPRPSIDTGMGLERLSAVLQGVHDNYEIDLFRNLIAASEDVTNTKAAGSAKSSHRVIADHLRSCSFMMLDGVTPSNEGRGYVLRRIMRRAMRHANMLGAKEPIMHKLVPALVAEMTDAYPDLKFRQELIINNFEQEELRFLRTLDRGMKLLTRETKSLGEGATLSGDIAFQLYDTYGFPLDLTEDALRERNIKIDTARFNACMQIQKDKARAAWKGSGDSAANQIWTGLQSSLPDTVFTGYDKLTDTASLLALVVDGKQSKKAQSGDSVELVFDKTPFYAESGGQAGDIGQVKFATNAVVQIHDTIKIGNLHILRGELLVSEVTVGDIATCEVDTIARANTERNHSATHLLHAALRQRLGSGVVQKGSHVGPDRLRFDFSNNNAVSAADLAAIEAEANAVIWQNLPVKTNIMSADEAKNSGAIALFGEKYGDEVRVLEMGAMPLQPDQAYSIELCGGTHVKRTADIGLLRIVSESAVASGIRRIEAVTGEIARMSFVADANLVQDLAVALKTSKARVLERTEVLIKDRKQMETELSEVKRKLAMSDSGGGTQGAIEDIDGISLEARIVEGVSGKDLRELVGQAKGQIKSGVVVFIAVNDDKASVCIGVTADLLDRIDAVILVKIAAEILGGKGGGGRPELAQAGGPNGGQSEAVLQGIRETLKKMR